MLTKKLEIIKGDDKTYTLTFTDNAGPIDISLWTVFFTAKDPVSLEDVIAKEIAAHSAPLDGETKVELTHADTDIERGAYPYFIAVETGAGERYTLMSGSLVVKEPWP